MSSHRRAAEAPSCRCAVEEAVIENLPLRHRYSRTSARNSDLSSRAGGIAKNARNGKGMSKKANAFRTVAF